MAFIAGLITSPHCIFMCGPLAFVLLKPHDGKEIKKSFYKVHAFYNLARIFSFTLVGCLAGAMGFGFVALFQISFVKALPWGIAFLLALYGLHLEKWIPKPNFTRVWLAKFAQKIHSCTGKTKRSILVGVLTPFMPCGPLYILIWSALLSESPLYGAKIAFSFGLGTLPLMYIVGTQTVYLQRVLTPKKISILQRALALFFACFLFWRLFNFSGLFQEEFCCPW